MKKYIGEIIGIFALNFCGTAAIVIKDVSNGIVVHLGIRNIYWIDSYGNDKCVWEYFWCIYHPCCFNSFFWLQASLKNEFIRYFIEQFLGAFLATGVLTFLFSEQNNLGTKISNTGWQHTFILK